MIRVLIADDFSAMRRAMEKLVDRAGDMSVVGEAPRFDEALVLIHTTPCDVIIMNDYIPPMSSARATHLLRKDGIQTPILVVSMHEDVELARRSLGNGANGFVLKTRFMEDFIPAIRAITNGQTFVSAPMAALLAEAEDEHGLVVDENAIGPDGGIQP